MGKKIISLLVLGLIIVLGSAKEVSAEQKEADNKTIITVADYRYLDEGPVGYFEVTGVDGKNHIAFCGWHEKKSPKEGWEMTTIDTFTLENAKNENIRKVLWYGHSGPKDIGASYVETALAASVALGHMDTDDTGETEGPIGKTFLNKVKNLESPPAEFVVHCVRNVEETEYKHQCLVYAIYEPNGEFYIKKESESEALVENNSCYSLENAIYGVYVDEKCTELIEEVKMDADGNSKGLELKEGKYYVKELISPEGYQLDETVYSVEIAAGKRSELKVSEKPIGIEVEELIIKYDSELEGNIDGRLVQGSGSLKDAQYCVDYYGEYIDDIQSLEQKKPLRSWVFKTDENGKIFYKKESLVSGDELWCDDSGKPVLPLGTIVVKEVKASKGYLLNEEQILQVLEGEGNNLVFEPILAKEQVIKGNIEILKQGVNESTNEITVLPDVTFLIESKTDGSIYRIITNADGKATTETIGGIPYDTYLVSEEKAPDGYLPCEPFEVCINEDGKTLLFVIDNKKCENEEIIVEDTEIIDENPPVNYEEEDEPVRTGDHNPLVKYISLTMITLLIVILCLKKKTTP